MRTLLSDDVVPDDGTLGPASRDLGPWRGGRCTTSVGLEVEGLS